MSAVRRLIKIQRVRVVLFALVLASVGTDVWVVPAGAAAVATPPDFKVAFIGDQGLGDDPLAVLRLIRDEEADMVLHQGDLAYANDPEAWDGQINSVLGSDFPYFASIGNHDCLGSAGCGGPGRWPGFQSKLQRRLSQIEGARCTGNLGVKSACLYKGLFFILSGVGTLGRGHERYITDQLAGDTSIWRICSWHKNQRLMQTGGKQDEVGWGAYEACSQGGAIIATGHEHSYARTHLMDDFETQSIASTSTTLKLENGRTFVFVSGLGGHSVRAQDDELAVKPWWGSVYNSTHGANFGALFCAFNAGGVETRAHCYFKDVGGVIADDFLLETSTQVPVPKQPAGPFGGGSRGVIGVATAAALLMVSVAWVAWRRVRGSGP